MKHLVNTAMVAVLVVLLCAVNATAQSTIVCDRGLPIQNLNNAAGASRSNVAWSFGNDWLSGDDCAVGAVGEAWVVTKLTGWSVQGTIGTIGPMPLGDRFSTVNLYLGVPGSALNMVSAGTLASGSNVNSNSSIVHTPVKYVGGVDYQGSSGSYIQVWQHDFSNLAFVIPGGTKLRFAGDGTLRTGANYYWFNHASNAALSGLTQQGADGFFLGWARADMVNPFFCDSGNAATCGGWDKSSDINVQIWAVKLEDGMATGGGWFVPEAANATNLALDGSKATFGFVAKSKNAAASGNLEFHYNASGINLNSSSLEWVQVASNQAMFEGAGTINGAGSYKFRVRVVDDTPDRFEIRIWISGGSFDSPLHRAEGNLGGGQIVVHKK